MPRPVPRRTKTRRRTNQHGLTSDLILETLRAEHPKAIEVRRFGDVFCVLRKAAKGEALKSNQRGIWEELASFDQYRLTANGTLTTRPAKLPAVASGFLLLNA
jgi:hypothetical protein